MQINEILKVHQSMELEKAIHAYESYLNQHPKDYFAQELLATAYAQSGETNIALERFLALYAQHPDRYSLLNHIALCYKAKQEYTTAQNYLEKLLSIHPMPVAYNNLATIFLQQNKPLLAKVNLLKAVSILPHYADAWFNLGLAMLQTDDQRSHLAFEESANLGHKKALYQLGSLHEQQQSYELAQSYLKQAIEQNTDYAQAHHAIARVYLASAQDELALEHFIQAQRINPHLPHLMANIAKYFHVKGQYANAIEYWSKVPTDEESPEEIQYNLGVSYHFMGQHKEAMTYFDSVLRLNPNHIDTHLNLAAIALQSTDRKKAIQHYQKVQSLEPDREDVNYLLAALLGKNYNTHPPQAYVKNLFDQYAHYYDKHLKSMLRYQVPDEIQLMLSEHIQHKVDKTIDLGCGSGILGPIIRPITKNLSGIDLSGNMLEQANQKHVYDTLVHDCCIQYTRTLKGINLFVAGDLLPYLSDPSELFESIANAAANNALFMFSFENGSEESYTLTQHARYQHQPSWIVQRLETYGFEIIEQHSSTLRYNQNKPVEGTMICAKITHQSMQQLA